MWYRNYFDSETNFTHDIKLKISFNSYYFTYYKFLLITYYINLLLYYKSYLL